MNNCCTVKILGTGMHVPARVVTNQDLEKMFNTSDEWIVQRSGIRERRFAEPHEAPSDLAKTACEKALVAADLNVADIDMLIVATLSPDAFFPGTSSFLQAKLGMGTKPAMDIRCQCTGFLYALNVGQMFVASGQYRRVMVVGTEIHSKALNFTDAGRDTAVLFGDGAGAVILGASDEPERGLIGFQLHAEGEHADRLWIEAPGLARSVHIDEEAVREGLAYPKMDGKFVFKHAVTRMPEAVKSILSRHHLSVKDIDVFLFHQANLRINEAVAAHLGIQADQLFNNIERYGNCSAAAIPMALDECVRSGRIRRGSLVCMAGFGSGFTWGSALLRF